jgi:TMEM175 potassium channel family protein
LSVRTTAGLERFVTFLDAITAIAITLLILPLVDIATHAEKSSSLGDLLRSSDNQIFGFLLSFVVIARFWSAHHAIFERVADYDDTIRVCSLAWALTIAVLPFPTQLVAVYSSDRGVVGLYIGLLVLSSTCLSVSSWHVFSRPELQRDGLTTEELSPIVAVTTTGLLLASLAIAMAIPAANYYSLLLLLLTRPIVQLWR